MTTPMHPCRVAVLEFLLGRSGVFADEQAEVREGSRLVPAWGCNGAHTPGRQAGPYTFGTAKRLSSVHGFQVPALALKSAAGCPSGWASCPWWMQCTRSAAGSSPKEGLPPRGPRAC